MKYTSKAGNEVFLYQPIRTTKRTLTFIYKEQHSKIPEEQKDCWGVTPISKITFRMAGNLCSEIRYRSCYVNPETNRMSMSYDIIFLTGENIVTGREVTNIMAHIEDAVAEELNVEIPSGHTHSRKQ